MKMLLISSLFLSMIFSINSLARVGGNEGGHGGDPYALEFTSLGETLAKDLIRFEVVNSNLMQELGLTAGNFTEVVKSTRIISDNNSNVVLKDAEVDAINFPDKNIILVNRDRWRQSNLLTRLKIVMHEYFGIMGIERDNYNASIMLAGFVNSVADKISADTNETNSLLVNLFYGRCVAYPSFSSAEICQSNSQELYKAVECSRLQAEGHCKTSGKTNCQIIETSFQPILSTKYVGARYCEVLTIIK